MTDARVYAIGETQGVDAVAARLGAIEDYEPADSWVLHAQGDYTRQRDVFSTLGVTHSLSSLNPTGVGVVPTQQPTTYNQFTGTGSVLKRFSNAFVSLGGSTVGILYNQPSGTVPPPSGVIFTAVTRGGIWVTPDIYTYVSGAVDKRNWDTSIVEFLGVSHACRSRLGSDRAVSRRDLRGLSAGELRFGGDRYGRRLGIWRPPRIFPRFRS